MTTIDPEGNELVWTAHYWQHGYQDSDEFDSAEEAFAYLDSGQEYGTLAGDHITGPDGAVLVDRDTLRGFTGPDDFAAWLGTREIKHIGLQLSKDVDSHRSIQAQEEAARAFVAETGPALTPQPIQTLSYDLTNPDGTSLVGKAIVDKAIYGRGYARYYCSPSIEPDDSDPNWSTT